MGEVFEQALGVEEPWYIESTDFDVLSKKLHIHINFIRGSYFSLEDSNEKYPVHDTSIKTWRHLNFFEHECFLHVRTPRVKQDNGRVITVHPPWAGRMLGFTLLFEALLVEMCRHMPVSQVSKMTGVNNKKLWQMLDVYVEAARYNEEYSTLDSVGIDETAVAKGHDYITLFVDLNKKRTLHIAQGKGSDTISDFANYLKAHKSSASQVRQVSCDMSVAFIKGIGKHLPNAQITFDKFHILKIINQAVDKVRREEAKTNPLLKNTRYIFLKNEQNLTKKQREKKQELQLENLNLKSMEAMRMRETFQQIYQAQTQQDFSSLLEGWLEWTLHCKLPAMQKAANTILRHKQGILNWKQTQLNNGILEGFNSIIQAAKRKARGYGKKHFAVIAFLLTGKLNLNKINQYLPTHLG